jgi:glycosyltransferase involved in cell wall biosynthesis
MRLFQNSGVYRSYRPRLAGLTRECRTFVDAKGAFLSDRFGAAHFLKPVLDGDPAAFFANGDDAFSQQLWACEQGLKKDTSLEEILLAQIEHHRTEVFYNMDPMRYGDAFIQRLPASVKRTVAWRAAPSQGGAFLKHDVIVNNFPSLLKEYQNQGARADYLFPAHDPEMDVYARREERPIDVLFVGTYSRHHRIRAAMLEGIAQLRGRMAVVMHLDTSRYTRLAETPLGWIGPLRKDRRSRDIRAVARPPVFGRDLLDSLSKAKIVVNGAIDMAGGDRGNMRVWEAMGCRSALLSDAGQYPEHLRGGSEFIDYTSASEIAEKITVLLDDEALRNSIANAGCAAVSNWYSKSRQWNAFIKIAS